MILDELAAAARRRVEAAKQRVPLEAVREAAEQKRAGSAAGGIFFNALAAPGLSFICEVKRASPSRGVIAADFPYLDIAREYEAAGAAAISVLTEPTRFLGRDEYLAGIARNVGVPVLRKDFVVDPYQLYEAKALGASAALLIAALLPEETLAAFIALTESLGIDALVEIHNETEAASALAAGARIIGINNRDLKNFAVDLSTTPRLRQMIPPGHIVVAESGVSTPADIAALGTGIDAVLVGESFMRAADKKRHLEELRAAYGRGFPRPRLKICGIVREEDAEAVNEAAPDYAGFVFAESRRRVTPARAALLRKHLRPAIETVGVFVDAPVDDIAALYWDGVIGAAQLHGSEDAAYIGQLKTLTSQAGGGPIPVIKTVKGAALTRLAERAAQRGGAADEGVCATLAAAADYLLFDSGAGSGAAFDWDLLPALVAGLETAGGARERASKKWFLAGGISTRNIDAAIQCCARCGAFGIDVSSGVETDGVKDRAKMLAIANAVRGLPSRDE